MYVHFQQSDEGDAALYDSSRTFGKVREMVVTVTGKCYCRSLDRIWNAKFCKTYSIALHKPWFFCSECPQSLRVKCCAWVFYLFFYHFPYVHYLLATSYWKPGVRQREHKAWSPVSKFGSCYLASLVGSLDKLSNLCTASFQIQKMEMIMSASKDLR